MSIPENDTPQPEGSGSPLDAILEHPTVQEKPEILVGAAFAGAFVLAKLLKAAGR